MNKTKNEDAQPEAAEDGQPPQPGHGDIVDFFWDRMVNGLEQIGYTPAQRDANKRKTEPQKPDASKQQHVGQTAYSLLAYSRLAIIWMPASIVKVF
jgi:hypothetical protein